MIPADMDKDAMLMYAQITIDRLTDEKQALAKQLAESELASASALEASEEARSLAEQKVSALKRAGLLPVDSLPKIAAPASQAAALTDEQITAIAQHAFANTDKLNDWSGFTKDEDGKYTVPFLTSKDIQLARVMLAAGASPVPAAPQWISVKEKLPSKDALVWYAILFEYTNAPARYSVGRGYYNGQWRDITGNAVYAPTHWMPADKPLPPPIPAAPAPGEAQ